MKPHARTPLAVMLFAFALCLCGAARADDAKDKAAGDDKKDAKASADLKKLQGEWTAPAGGGGDDIVYTFKNDKLTVKTPSRTYEMTVTLDDKAKPHRTIDFKIDKGPEDAKGKTSKGVYKFAGDDKFVFCFTPEGDRPEKFEQVGVEQFLVELKRKESKKDSKNDSK
jgi:uncharacterized protein (TIGR03067 family)